MRRSERRERLKLTGAYFPSRPGYGKENKPGYESGERAAPRPLFRQNKRADKPVDARDARSRTRVQFPPPPSTWTSL